MNITVMVIFLFVALIYFSQSLANTSNEVKISYTIATCFMHALILLLLKVG